jgi:hypothetical protein
MSRICINAGLYASANVIHTLMVHAQGVAVLAVFGTLYLYNHERKAILALLARHIRFKACVMCAQCNVPYISWYEVSQYVLFYRLHKMLGNVKKHMSSRSVV